MTLFEERCKRLVQRATDTHLSLIARSSFHQTTHIVSRAVSMPTTPNHAYKMRDHADEYFLEQVMVAFEVDQNPYLDRRDIREVFPKKWDDMLWCIWWWANGEDKARAKMERWRQEPLPEFSNPAGVHMGNI